MTTILQSVIKRRFVLFCVWLALLAASGAALPSADTPLPPLAFALILLSGFATVLLGISLAVHFYDRWQRLVAVPDRLDYAISLAMETLIGVPIALICVTLPAAAACTLMLHLASL